MKILFFISNMNGGGAQRVLWSLANHFCSLSGYKVWVATNLSSTIAYRFEEKVEIMDLERDVSAARGFSHYLQSLLSIRKIYREISPDIVISFQRGMNGMVLLALLGIRAKIICSEHSYFLRKYGLIEDVLKSLLYWRASAITVLTRHDFKLCKRKNNFVYMPNPLQEKEFSLSNRCKQVLAAGEVDRWEVKGFDLLLKAWGQICHRHQDWKLLIAGKGSEKSIKLLKDFAAINNCINVEFLGFREDILYIMQKSSIFALSSRFEGLPMALLEAMAAGCCCVAFDCETGPNEIIRNQVDGVLVPAQNVNSFSRALDNMINDEETRRIYSAKAMQSVQRKYSEAYVVNRWKILFSKI